MERGNEDRKTEGDGELLYYGEKVLHRTRSFERTRAELPARPSPITAVFPGTVFFQEILFVFTKITFPNLPKLLLK